MSTLELEPQFRSELRAAAHSLKPVIQIGDKGLSDAVLAEIERALSAHGLIKIRVAGEDRVERAAIQGRICDALGCAPVHHLGKILTVYRPTKADPYGQKFRREVADSIQTLGVQPRTHDEPYIPKKLAAMGGTLTADAPKRPARSQPKRPVTARERYLGAATGSRNQKGRASTQGRSSRPRSALSLRAGARRTRGKGSV